MTVPRVLYLTINADASAWWRVVRPVTRLAEAGYPCAWAELDDVDLATIGESYDAVVLTRFYWTDHEYGRRLVDDLHRQGLAVLYEIDDDWLSEGVSERLVAACAWTARSPSRSRPGPTVSTPSAWWTACSHPRRRWPRSAAATPARPSSASRTPSTPPGGPISSAITSGSCRA
jgi:hypothetical protein